MSPGIRFMTSAIALLAVAVGYVLVQGRAERPGPRLPRPEISQAAPPPRPAITAHAILASGIPLGRQQRAALERMAVERDRESAVSEAALVSAGREFEQFMAEAQASSRTTLADIQRGSQTVRELTIEVGERRRRHAEEALSVLDDTQRAELERRRSEMTMTADPGGRR